VRQLLVPAAYVVAGILAFALFWALARYLRDLAGRWLVRHHAQADAVVLGRRVVYVTLLVLGAVIALSFAFNNGNVTIAGIVVATVITSFGVQDVLKNYVSGYYVLLEGHIHVGDRIEFDGHGGVIEDIRLRVSLLRGEDGSLVIVPNTELFNSAVSVRPRGETPRRPRGLRKRAQEDPAEGLEAI
jgi:small-conductance mechanosensitive channel